MVVKAFRYCHFHQIRVIQVIWLKLFLNLIITQNLVYQLVDRIVKLLSNVAEIFQGKNRLFDISFFLSIKYWFQYDQI